MSLRDLVYVGHMLDLARKAVSKTQGISRETYDADENLRLAVIHLIQTSARPPDRFHESSARTSGRPMGGHHRRDALRMARSNVSISGLSWKASFSGRFKIPTSSTRRPSTKRSAR
jgi:hypothetical protein